MHKIMIAFSISIIALIIAGVVFVMDKRSDEGVALGPMAVDVGDAEIGGPFTLVDQTGATVTQADVITGPTLIYFGYTFCPDVCPVDVSEMADAVDILARDGIEVRPVFISLDPERDTPEQLAWFVGAMHPDMLGLTGTPDAVAEAAEAYKVYFQRVEVPGSEADYLMNHTSFTYLMMPDGIAGLLRGDATATDVAREVQRALRRRAAES